MINNWSVRLVTSVAGCSKEKCKECVFVSGGGGGGRFTEKVPKRITLRSSCLLGWGAHGGEERLGPGQDNLNRLRQVCGPPPTPTPTRSLSHNAYRKESSNLSTDWEEKGHHHQVLGSQQSRRSLVLGVGALGEEVTELVPMITFTFQLPILG